jgi:hypothetical protein
MFPQDRIQSIQWPVCSQLRLKVEYGAWTGTSTSLFFTFVEYLFPMTQALRYARTLDASTGWNPVNISPFNGQLELADKIYIGDFLGFLYMSPNSLP